MRLAGWQAWKSNFREFFFQLKFTNLLLPLSLILPTCWLNVQWARSNPLLIPNLLLMCLYPDLHIQHFVRLQFLYNPFEWKKKLFCSAHVSLIHLIGNFILMILILAGCFMGSLNRIMSWGCINRTEKNLYCVVEMLKIESRKRKFYDTRVGSTHKRPDGNFFLNK